jgi:hypothetical protein
MKRFFSIIALVVAAAGVQAPAEAAFINGNQAFISTATTSAPGNNVNNNTFNFNFSTLSGGINQTGDFFGEMASFTNILDTTNNTTAATFVFGNAAFGTFTVSGVAGVNQNTLNPGVARVLNFTGTYTPGTDFGGAFDPTPATLSITINQASPGVLSASATLATSATSVPEPSTIIMLGTLCIPAAVGLLRRRRSEI